MSNLFKYIPFTKFTFIEDILYRKSLYFSFPHEFNLNDAYDCRAFNIVIKSKRDMELLIMDDIEVNSPHLSDINKKRKLEHNLAKFNNPEREYFKGRMKSMNQTFKNGPDDNKLAILCFTDSSKNIKMWNEYIPDQQGVCIRVNTDKIISHLLKTNISYSDINPHLHHFSCVNYEPNPIDIPYSFLFDKNPLEVGIKLLYTKLNYKSFEQEWRFVIYECIEQSIQFPEDIIEEVFVAPKTTKDQYDNLDKWNLARNLPYNITPIDDLNLFSRDCHCEDGGI